MDQRRSRIRGLSRARSGSTLGTALFAAQEGKTDPAAKPLKGFGGANVLEIIASHHGNAWRAVYACVFWMPSMSCMHFRRNPHKVSRHRQE